MKKSMAFGISILATMFLSGCDKTNDVSDSKAETRYTKSISEEKMQALNALELVDIDELISNAVSELHVTWKDADLSSELVYPATIAQLQRGKTGAWYAILVTEDDEYRVALSDFKHFTHSSKSNESNSYEVIKNAEGDLFIKSAI